MMLVAAVVISTPDVTVHANTTMPTFPVQAGAGPHDVYPAPDGAVGSRRNLRASWVGLILGQASQI